jgi:hypothetical protein
MGLLYAFLKSKKEHRLNFFFKLIYILIFWLVIYYFIILHWNLFYINTIISPFWVSIFSAYFFNCLDFFDHPNLKLQEILPEYLNLFSPDDFYAKIEKLMEAIRNELERSGSQGPNDPYDFLSVILGSSRVSDEEYNNLLNLLKDNDVKEFYNKIPKFLKYAEDLSNVYILNDNIYISDYYAKYLLISPPPLGPAASQPGGDINNSFELMANPSLKEVRVLDINNFVLNSEGKKFYYFSSISELLNCKLKIKDEIDIINKKFIPMDKNKYFEIWDFVKKNYFFWHIEPNAGFYVNDYLYSQNPFNELTINKFIYAKYLSAWEYSEEYSILLKAKIWYEDYKGFKTSDLSESTLSEYKELFIKFCMRQILSFNRLEQLNQDTKYLVNMYDLNNLYLELLENIIFVQFKILDAYWTINTVNKLIPLKGDLQNINTDSKLIDFYNSLYEQFKIEILEKYKDISNIRREFFADRCSNYNYEQILFLYENLIELNKHIEFNSKLNKDNFYKTPFN